MTRTTSMPGTHLIGMLCQKLLPDFPVNLAKETRHLIRHSRVDSVAEVDTTMMMTINCRIVMILLSDMCILCDFQEIQLPTQSNRRQRTKLVYSVKMVLPVHKLEARTIEGNKFQFELIAPNIERILLEAATQQERDDWVADFVSASNALEAEQRSSILQLQAAIRASHTRKLVKDAQLGESL